MRILVTKPKGRHTALYEVDEKGTIRESTLTPEVKQALEAIAESCEISTVSGVYIGGAGGSAYVVVDGKVMMSDFGIRRLTKAF